MKINNKVKNCVSRNEEKIPPLSPSICYVFWKFITAKNIKLILIIYLFILDTNSQSISNNNFYSFDQSIKLILHPISNTDCFWNDKEFNKNNFWWRWAKLTFIVGGFSSMKNKRDIRRDLGKCTTSVSTDIQ